MRKPRPALSKSSWRRLRARVKQAGVCFYCGTRQGPFEADHLVPPSQGGSELDPGNVVCACVPCNRSKRDRTPEQWAGSDAPHNPSRTRRTVYSRPAADPWARVQIDYSRGLIRGDYSRRRTA